MTPIRAETAAAATEAAAVLKIGSFRLQANGDIGTGKKSGDHVCHRALGDESFYHNPIMKSSSLAPPKI